LRSLLLSCSSFHCGYIILIWCNALLRLPFLSKLIIMRHIRSQIVTRIPMNGILNKEVDEHRHKTSEREVSKPNVLVLLTIDEETLVGSTSQEHKHNQVNKIENEHHPCPCSQISVAHDVLQHLVVQHEEACSNHHAQEDESWSRCSKEDDVISMRVSCGVHVGRHEESPNKDYEAETDDDHGSTNRLIAHHKLFLLFFGQVGLPVFSCLKNVHVDHSSEATDGVGMELCPWLLNEDGEKDVVVV